MYVSEQHTHGTLDIHMGLCPFCCCHSGNMYVSIINLFRGTCPKSIQKVKEMTLRNTTLI